MARQHGEFRVYVVEVCQTLLVEPLERRPICSATVSLVNRYGSPEATPALTLVP